MLRFMLKYQIKSRDNFCALRIYFIKLTFCYKKIKASDRIILAKFIQQFSAYIQMKDQTVLCMVQKENVLYSVMQ